MSLPVGTTVSGIDSLRVPHQNLRIATDFAPMSGEEMQALRDRVATLASDGRLRPRCTTTGPRGGGCMGSQRTRPYNATDRCPRA
jgi:hypothetical protein